jgi:deazaflavin-dependent oxidoreductase (nitroreductase family)
MPSSRADVLTPRADRYSRELVQCLARRLPATLDGTTTLVLTDYGRALITPLGDAVRLEVDSGDDLGLRRLEDLVGGQLLALSGPRELGLEWVRSTGSARQVRSVALPDGRRHAAARGPGPGLRALMRLPGLLYRFGLGAVLGHRFLQLTHTGRRSGHPQRTVLEVLAWDPARQEAAVMSAFGRGSDWYLNVRNHPYVQVAIGRDRFAAEARELDPDSAEALVAEFERRTRFVALPIRVVLSGLLGWRYYGTPAQRRRLVAQLPVMAFRRTVAGVDIPGVGVDHLHEPEPTVPALPEGRTA